MNEAVLIGAVIAAALVGTVLILMCMHSEQQKKLRATPMKQVIVIRKDLRTAGGQKVRSGKLLAQVAHVGHLVAHNHRDDPRYKAWMAGKIRKIVVGIDSIDALEELIEQAKEAGVIVTPIVDSGLTEFDGVPTLTCVGFGPDSNAKLDPLTGRLPLQ